MLDANYNNTGIARTVYVDDTEPATGISIPVNGNKYRALPTVSGTAGDSVDGVVDGVIFKVKRNDEFWWNFDLSTYTVPWVALAEKWGPGSRPYRSRW